MTVQMLKGKIHRATVKQAELNYVGSITVDADLLDQHAIGHGREADQLGCLYVAARVDAGRLCGYEHHAAAQCGGGRHQRFHRIAHQYAVAEPRQLRTLICGQCLH